MKNIEKNERLKKPILILALAGIFLFTSSCDDSDNDNSTLLLALAAAGLGGGSACTDECTMFVTEASFNGNLGGVDGADEKCMADSARPAGDAVYKALIFADERKLEVNYETGAGRDEIDYPLKASTTYVLPDGSVVARTNEYGVFITEIGGTDQIMAVPSNLGNDNHLVWTGIDFDTGSKTIFLSGRTCSNWTSDSGSEGTIGEYESGEGFYFAYGFDTCNLERPLVCAQQ